MILGVPGTITTQRVVTCNSPGTVPTLPSPVASRYPVRLSHVASEELPCGPEQLCSYSSVCIIYGSNQGVLEANRGLLATTPGPNPANHELPSPGLQLIHPTRCNKSQWFAK